ncbi:MAG: 1-acyl-sn-glycerol-3-phosphate acyltransferase [Treponema sp.]|nr:1-acyl-sn-glycerol-3-phosphate acyltransferase [Treponema sp.]MBD5409056.1 1-acyl-sn-glycerol-3-phosphate acyltransferase [Treponema sp.]MBD5443511.1 1-acyl-sn-glycerol-3-phosphate acyltransferase [Treponema sp.]
MLRFFYLIVISFPIIIFFVIASHIYACNPKKFDEKQCFCLAKRMIYILKKISRIETAVSGLENLPKDGGYMMISNHQGKYDALGIMYAHETPCQVVMDLKKSKMIVANEYIMMVHGKRLDRTNPRQQIRTMQEVEQDIKQGKKILIFPEAGYTNNKNMIQCFYPTPFKYAKRTRRPIVPIVIYDSWKPFTINSIRKIKTQVHFLKPLNYDEIQDLSAEQIRDIVVDRIQDKLNQIAVL